MQPQPQRQPEQHPSHRVGSSKTKGKDWASFAIASLHAQVVHWIRRSYSRTDSRFLEAQSLLSEATDRFFDEQYAEAGALANRGIELLGEEESFINR